MRGNLILHKPPGKCTSCGQTLATHHELTNPIVFADGSMLPAQYQVTEFCDNSHCPSKQKAKHDGKLDTYDHDDKPPIKELHTTVGLEPAEISWTNKHLVAVHGGYGDYESNLVYLDPQQALSLLTWLQQEERALVKLVVEEQSCAGI